MVSQNSPRFSGLVFYVLFLALRPRSLLEFYPAIPQYIYNGSRRIISVPNSSIGHLSRARNERTCDTLVACVGH